MCAQPSNNKIHDLLQQIRRNHALEHATVHLLSQRFPDIALIGRSDNKGFFIFGDVPSDVLHNVVDEALNRLRNGEHQLAIHPNCGTNLVTSATLAGFASFLSLFGSKNEGWRKRFERLPYAIMLTVVALLIAQPLGSVLQRRYTTTTDLGALSVHSIQRVERGSSFYFRVLTRG